MKKSLFLLVLVVILAAALSACGSTKKIYPDKVGPTVPLSSDNMYIGTWEAAREGSVTLPNIDGGAWMNDANDNCVYVGSQSVWVTLSARPDHRWEYLYSRGGYDVYCLFPGSK